MKSLKPDDVDTGLHEIQITIDVNERYFEMIEIYRESENGPGFVQVTSFKTIEPHAGCEQDFSTNLKGRIS
jgi:hypothetical protein